jgi:Ca-activated chloride channel homolog
MEGSFKNESLGRLRAGVCLAMLFATASVYGQQDQSAVHVTPRMSADHTAGVGSSPRGAAPVEVNVNLVLVPVLVTDALNRPVNNLQKTNFAVLENGQEQPIKYFSREDAPISIGVVFDRSGSMNRKLPKAREALDRFLRASNPADEFFVVTVSDEPAVLSKFTSSVKDLENKLIYTPAMGHTALLDAIDLAMKGMRGAHNARKCLLVITDGGDNHSRSKASDVKSLLMESDVLLYSVGIFDESPQTQEERLGPFLLDEITEVTGGRNIVVTDRKKIPAALNTIATELHSQYVLGYYPVSSQADGQWHQINVRLIPPDRTLRLQIKKGYFATSN